MPTSARAHLAAVLLLSLSACGGGLSGPVSTTPSSESITNNQVDGVDEGDIVKARGDTLLILRRGRLFSVDIADGIRPVSRIDVPHPGIEPGWYDEMLVRGDSVIVLGYNYSQRASEIALFDVDGGGALSRRGTFFLRSGDYYSSRNYASRRVGDQLVFYMPYDVDSGPRIGTPEGWDDVPVERQTGPGLHRVLHTIVSCDLSTPELRCAARGVEGGWARSFYVSGTGVYVWTGAQRARHGGPDAVVYRLPFDREEPARSLRTWGMPIDQLSFHEDDTGALNVMVAAEAYGDRMWGPEWSRGDLALMRAPLSDFRVEGATVDRARYRELSRMGTYGVHNRFVGDHLVYGSGRRLGVVAYRGAGRHVDHLLGLNHPVERIDTLGDAAVVVGSEGRDLWFSSVSLGALPRVAGQHRERDAAQGETRTHGFFFHPSEGSDGVLGLPVRSGGGSAWASLHSGSAGVLFLEVEALQFRGLGRLDASDERVDDRCVASCVDWYGNARPIFYRGRIFALLGYELVEGRLADRRMVEVQRASFLL